MNGKRGDGMIGQELGGRYELLERVGGGGMAVVYKAHDQLLGRKVAIKVLRQQFVNDEDFIRRFRREAQSAASLSHPNVVSIYDVGQEADIHYIVMEYVEGKNLNEVIKERAPLQAEEAVNIAAQICDALDHAHQNGIIHRDIKPHNILIGRNGRVKVTDFGIARAVTSSDITQTGSVIGSVHYFSPEQAKGASQGEKSDLYSLGIVLYQMLTNRLPFLGESPISVALKHLQEEVMEPRKANPMIPQSVENIILKALRKNPDERYQSAREMLEDLETALLPERRNEPKITFPAQDSYVEEDEHPTRVMPAIGSQPSPEPDTADAEPDGEDSREQVKDKSRPKWIKPAAWIAFTAALIAGLYYGVLFLQDRLIIPDVPVPDVTGRPLDEAKAMLEEAGLGFEVLHREYHDELPEETVISQDREPGMTAKENTVVGLVVSLGPKTEVMDDYIGRNVQEVIQDLQNLGVNKEQIVQETVQDEEPAGTVLQQSPAPDEEFIPTKVSVKLVVSEGPGTFAMPDLIEETEAAAMSKLTQLGLKSNVVSEPHYAVPEGLVFQQHPQPNDPVAEGETVTLYVSSGLPDDAREFSQAVVLTPSKEGQKSVFEIIVSDARGELQEWGTRETSQEITIEVPVVVSPEKSANITVLENDRYYNIYTITYQDAVPAPDSRDEDPQEDEEEPGNRNEAESQAFQDVPDTGAGSGGQAGEPGQGESGGANLTVQSTGRE